MTTESMLNALGSNRNKDI